MSIFIVTTIKYGATQRWAMSSISHILLKSSWEVSKGILLWGSKIHLFPEKQGDWLSEDVRKRSIKKINTEKMYSAHCNIFFILFNFSNVFYFYVCNFMQILLYYIQKFSNAIDYSLLRSRKKLCSLCTIYYTKIRTYLTVNHWHLDFNFFESQFNSSSH